MSSLRENVNRSHELPSLGHVEGNSLYLPGSATAHETTPSFDRPILGRIGVSSVLFAYGVAIFAAELTSNFYGAVGGVTLHLFIFASLIVHGATNLRLPTSALWLSLSLVPLIRVLSFGLPLSVFPQEWWYLITGIPLLAAAITVMRSLGISRDAVGLKLPSPGALPLTIIVAVSGIAIGLGEYAILGPAATFNERGSVDLMLAVVILLVGTGLTEELIFRGVLQTTAMRVLRPAGAVMLVSTMFALMHVGHGSLANVFYVFAISVYFCIVRQRTDSLLGVVIAHTLANVVFFVVLS